MVKVARNAVIVQECVILKLLNVDIIQRSLSSERFSWVKRSFPGLKRKPSKESEGFTFTIWLKAFLINQQMESVVPFLEITLLYGPKQLVSLHWYSHKFQCLAH